MAQDNESRKWLYNTLSERGYNVGKDYAEFDQLMNDNPDSRKWVFETMGGLGYNVGKDYDEFEGLVNPVVKQEEVANNNVEQKIEQQPVSFDSSLPTWNDVKQKGINFGGSNPYMVRKPLITQPKLSDPTKVDTGFQSYYDKDGNYVGRKFVGQEGNPVQKFVEYQDKKAEEERNRPFEDRVSDVFDKYGAGSEAEDVWNEAEERGNKELIGYLEKRNQPTFGNIMRDLAASSNITGGSGDVAEMGMEAFASHLKYHDLQKMADAAWYKMGEEKKYSIVTDIYRKLQEYYPDGDKDALMSEAMNIARQQSDKRVYDLAVAKNTPKDALDLFFRKTALGNTIGDLMMAGARAKAGTTGDLAAREEAENAYEKEHKLAGVAGTVAGFALDPLVYAGGMIGGAGVKGGLWLGGKVASRFLDKGATSAVASRLGQMAARKFGTTLGGRIASGAVGGGLNFGTYEAGKEAAEQLKWGGHRNPKTGEIEDYSLEEVGKRFGHGLMMGAVTGTISPMLGNISDKLVRATQSTAGKMAYRAGELGVGTVAEGTIFSVPEAIQTYSDYEELINSLSDENSPNYIADDAERAAKIKELTSNRNDAILDVWNDNMIMMAGFKANHLLKSAPRVIAELAQNPVKTKAGFETRLRNMLNGQDGLTLTKDEEKELRNGGYDDLRTLVRDYEDNQAAKSLEKGLVKFDGAIPYNRFVELMQDTGISEAARAKMYYYLTGNVLPMSTIYGVNFSENKDPEGNITGYTVESFGNNGVVTRRTFDSKDRANVELDNVKRQIELNTIDIGERYYKYGDEQASNNRMFDAAKAVADKYGYDVYVVRDLLFEEKPETLTGKQKEIVDAVQKEYNRMGEESLGNMRDGINEKYGVDVDKAIGKEPNRRSEEENAAVKEYTETLYTLMERGQRWEQKTEDMTRLIEGTIQESATQEHTPEDLHEAVLDETDAAEVLMQTPDGERVKNLIDTMVLDGESNGELSRYLDGAYEATRAAAERYIQAKAKNKGVDIQTDEKAKSAVDLERERMSQFVNKDIMKESEDGNAEVLRPVDYNGRKGFIVSSSNGEAAVVFPDNGEKLILQLDDLTRFADVSLDEYMDLYAQDMQNEIGGAVENARVNNPRTKLKPVVDEVIDTAEGQKRVGGIGEDGLIYLEEPDMQTDKETGQLVPKHKATYEPSDAVTPEQFVQMQNEFYDAQDREAKEAEKKAAQAQAEEEGNAAAEQPNQETQQPVEEKSEDDKMVERLLGRDEKSSGKFIKNNLDAIEKELKKAQKKESTATNFDQFEKETAEYEAEVKKWEAEKARWEGIQKRVREQRAAERNARQAALTEQAAVDEQKRQEEELRKREEQEALGASNVAPQIKEKWDAAPKVDGVRNEIVLANGERVPGHYVLVESGAATPSHNPNAEFAKNEGFPMDENEQSVNDRDYERDQDAQNITRQIAGQYDQRALQTPVVVSNDGVVLSGNGRTMAGELAAQNGTDGAYIDYLKKYPEQFGFTKEQVEGMEHPRVLFVPDESMPYTADTFAKFNQQEMKGQSKSEQAVKLGKIVDDETFGRIIKSINGFDTLGDFYADTKAASQAINELRKAGAISQAQYAEMFDGDAISAQGKEMLENMLVGKAFESNPDAVRQITSYKSMRQSIITALAEISNNLVLGEDFSLESELAQAIDLVYNARNNGYKAGDAVSMYARQGNLFQFDEGATVADYNNATVMMLADVLNDSRVTRLKKWLTLYNQAARESANGQMDIFSGGVKTQQDIIDEVKQLLNYGTEEEQQAAIDNAVEQRKAESVQQNGFGSNGNEGNNVKQSEQLKPTDLRDGVKPDSAELGADEAKGKAKSGFLDAIKDLYSKGKEYASKLYNRTFFDVAETPDFMKKLGLTGDKFTIRYGVLSRHTGKDANHDFPLEVWEQLPEALQNPFAISKYYEDEDKTKQKGYRIYTTIQLADGSYVVVGAEVKNAGRDIEVNAIDTIFGRNDGVGSHEDLIYTSPTITPEQQALLDGHNPHQYPAEREQSEGKGTEVSDNKQEKGEKSSEKIQGLEGYDPDEVLFGIRGDIEMRLEEAGLDDVVIKDMALIGSRMRGDADEDSDLDVLLEYEGDISEDGLFNILNETPIEIEGIKVDINPITKGKSGTIAEFLKRNEGYKKEGGNTSSPEDIEAEEKVVNTNPTEGQKKAGNYKMGHIKVDGFDMTIENPKGSVRRGTDAEGRKWEQKMNNTYGYIRGTEGVDGDHIDVFLSDDPTQGDVFVVDQVNKDGSFDEHKVMYGFPDVESARQAYLSNYEEGWQGLGAITPVSKEEFKKWVESSHRKTKPFAEYSSVKTLGDVQLGEGSNAYADVRSLMNELQPAYREWTQAILSGEKDDNIWKKFSAARNRIDKALRQLTDEQLKGIGDAFGEDYTGVLSERVKEEERRREKKAVVEKIFADGLAEQGDVSGEAKEPKAELDGFTETSELRPAMNGVYYDPEGYAVASDGKILIADKTQFDKKNSGKIVLSHKLGEQKKGDELTNDKYPQWRMVIPNKEGMESASVSFDGIRDFLAGAEDALKAQWNKEKEDGGKPVSFSKWVEDAVVGVRMPDGEVCVYNYPKLRLFTDAAQRMGMTNVYYGETSPLFAENKNGILLLMPTMPDALTDVVHDGKKVYYEWNAPDLRIKEPVSEYNAMSRSELVEKKKGEVKPVDFENETMEEWLAFEKRVPKMSDEELLAYMEAQGETQAYHPSVFDEYDERHKDEYADRVAFYKKSLDNMLEGVSREEEDEVLERVREMQESAQQQWENGGYSSSERTALQAQMDAIDEWIDEFMNREPESLDDYDVFEAAKKVVEREKTKDAAKKIKDNGLTKQTRKEFSKSQPAAKKVKKSKAVSLLQGELFKDEDFEDSVWEEMQKQDSEDSLVYSQILERRNTSLEEAKEIRDKIAQMKPTAKALAQLEAVKPYVELIEREQEELANDARRKTEKKNTEGETQHTGVKDLTQIKLRPLKEGETCNVERRYAENGFFNFTGTEKVESVDDVAYIFKELQNSSMENGFIVLVKDGVPTVIHVGMGSYKETMLAGEQALVAFREINPDKVYMVHNHPSGKLTCSKADRELYAKMKTIFGGKLRDGIIIDTTSGKYGTFYEMDDTGEFPIVGSGNKPVKTYTFSKTVFAPDWNPENAFKARNSNEIAQFISSHRLGEHDKLSLLVVTNNQNITGNVFLPWTNMADAATKEGADLIAYYMNQMGGTSVIVYGSTRDENDKNNSKELKKLLKSRNVHLVDVLRIGEDPSDYESMAENGVMEPGGEYEKLDEINKRFNERLIELDADKEMKNPQNRKDRVLYLGKPSKFLIEAGISNGEIQMDFDKFLRKSSEDYEHSHPYTAEDIKDLPKAISAPIAVFDSTNNNDKNDKVILTEMKKDGRNFVVVIRAREQRRKGGVTLEVNDIQTLFPKNAKGIIKWIIDDLFTLMDKKKALRLIGELQTHLGTAISKEELNDATKVVETSNKSKDFEEKNESNVENLTNQPQISSDEGENRGKEYSEADGEQSIAKESDAEEPTEKKKKEKPNLLNFGNSMTEALLKLASTHENDLQQKNKAITRVIDELVDKMKRLAGGEKESPVAAGAVRSAVGAQRQYDRATVNDLVEFAKVLMDTGLIKNIATGEMKKLMNLVKGATGKEDLEDSVNAVSDVLIDNVLRESEGMFARQLKTQGSKLSGKGVEVQGKLDVEGQRMLAALKEGLKMDKDALADRIAECENKMDSDNAVTKKNAAVEYQGLMIAKQYMDEIHESEQEALGLKKELREFLEQYYDFDKVMERREDGKVIEREVRHIKPEYKNDPEVQKLIREFRNAIEAGLRENKVERIIAYKKLSDSLGGDLKESIERAKDWRQQEVDRVNEIHHNANSDLEGISARAQTEEKEGGLAKFPLLRYAFGSLATFEKLMRFFGRKSPNGEGYLFNRFVRGYVEASDKEWRNTKAANDKLDAKAKEIFDGATYINKDGKEKKFPKLNHLSDLYEIDREDLPTIDVEYWDEGEKVQDKLTQLEALYMYMANKMNDGKMKLRKMGVSEEDIERMTGVIDPHLIEWADWIQDTFLHERREAYNAVHERMFGAPMAAIENYITLKVQERSLAKNQDISERANDSTPSTITGSVIKRTKNAKPLNIHTNAIDLVLEHIDKMEHWAAYAEINRDLNALLNYKRFENRVRNMDSVEFGSGKDLWEAFEDVSRIVTGVYQGKRGKHDKLAVNIAKGATMAAIQLRTYTAIKQLFSIPAFWNGDASLTELAKSLNMVDTWKWAMDNLPTFSKRWEGRKMGDVRLQDTKDDFGFWHSTFVKKLNRVGMFANAGLDALACACGAKAVYETKKARYLKQGLSEEQAEKKALTDAAISFNNSQQSAEGAFISPVQSDRTVDAVAMTVFRTASMGYERRLTGSLRTLKNAAKPGYKDESIAFMKKQFERMGLDEEQAEKAAKQEYKHGINKAIVEVALFGWVLPLFWNLTKYFPYMIGGDDDDEKIDMLKSMLIQTIFGPVEGLVGGNVVSDVGTGIIEAFRHESGLHGLLSRSYPQLPFVDEVLRIGDNLFTKPIETAVDVVNLLAMSNLGVNPQVLIDVATAIVDVANADPLTGREIAMFVMRLLQVPQSQLDQIYIDELGMSGKEARKLRMEDVVKRYMAYKEHGESAFLDNFYTDEYKEKVDKRFTDKMKDMVKARLFLKPDGEIEKMLIRSQPGMEQDLLEKVLLNRVDAHADEWSTEELAEAFDKAELQPVRKKLATRISKDAGASEDPYGDKTTKYNEMHYQDLRTANDVYEDALLLAAQQDARDAGDEELKNEISKERSDVREWINDFGVKPDAEVMQHIRADRKKLLDDYVYKKEKK